MSIARAIGRNTVATAIARFAVLFAWLIATPQVLDALGAARFGLWSIFFVIASVLLSFDFGVGAAVSRFLGELSGRGHVHAFVPLIAKAVALQLGLLVLLCVPTWLLRHALLDFFSIPATLRPEAETAFAWSLIAFAGGGLVNLLTGCLQGLQRMDLVARISVPAALVLYFGILWAVAQPAPLAALTRVQAFYSLAMLAAFVVAFRLAAATAGAPDASGAVEPRGPGVSWRDLVGLGGWIQVTVLFGLVQNNVDKVLLGRLAGLEPVGALELATRLVLVAFLPVTFFLSALLPALGRLAGAVDDGDAAAGGRRAVYRVALAPFYFVVVGIAGGVIALAGAALEAWLGQPPADAAWMARLVAPAMALNLAAGIAGTMSRATRHVHHETMYGAGMVSLHVVLSLVFFSAFGLRGILLGAVVSAIVAGAWLVRRVEGWLDLPPLVESGRALAGPLVAATLATALVLGLDSLLAAGEPTRLRGFVRLLAGGGLYAVAYLAVLVLGFRRTWGETRERLTRALAGARDAVR